jgi:cytochrome P450
MAFTLLELARNPQEQRKVQMDLASKTTAEEWSNSKILQMAIKESMRLHPVSTVGSNRQLGRDFVTKEGWKVRKKSIVTCSIGLLHHNYSVFEDADKYIPSRWENPSKAQKESFLIFSAGKQNCIGQSLANAELHCILPRILSEVELEVEEEGRTEWFLTLKPVGAMLRPKLRM